MPIATMAVTGSIATDRMMHFPGRFAYHLLPGSWTGYRSPSSSTTWSYTEAASPSTSRSASASRA
jgi:hypothetical protein